MLLNYIDVVHSVDGCVRGKTRANVEQAQPVQAGGIHLAVEFTLRKPSLQMC